MTQFVLTATEDVSEKLLLSDGDVFLCSEEEDDWRTDSDDWMLSDPQLGGLRVRT